MEVESLMVEISREEYERLKRMEKNLFPMYEPQVLDTGPNGLILVEQMYVSAELGAAKIVKLANGGYCYESGLPVDKRKDFNVIPPGPERDAALYWFDTRLDEEKTPQIGIIVRPDLSLSFEDGRPVESIIDITQTIKPGPHQEFLIRCFMSQEAKKPSDTPEWMVKQEEKPRVTKKVAPKKAKKGKKAMPTPAPPPPLEEARAE